MHHTEHQFSNLGCSSVVDVVVVTIGEGCSADAIGSGSTSSNTDASLRGICSTDAVLTLARSVVVQMQHLHSIWWIGSQTLAMQKDMLQNRLML